MYKGKTDDIELAGELYPFESRYEQRSNSHRQRALRSKKAQKTEDEKKRVNSRKNQKK